MGLLDLQHPTGREKEEYYYYLPTPLPEAGLNFKRKANQMNSYLPFFV